MIYEFLNLCKKRNQLEIISILLPINFILLTYMVFEMIPPVLSENKHDTSRQNVPIANVVAIRRKKRSGNPV